MSALSCPNCGANLEAPQSVRIAEYHFGHLEKADTGPLDPAGFRYQKEQPDVYTILCNTCKRLVRTLPIPAP
jgi:hypothetical protein